MFIRFLGFLLLAQCLLNTNLHAQQASSSNDVMGFANYLLLTQQYQLATLELERIHFEQPDLLAAQIALVESNRLSGRHLLAKNYAVKFSEQVVFGTQEWNLFKREVIRNALLIQDYTSIPSVIAEIRLLNNVDTAMYRYADNISLGMSILQAEGQAGLYHIHTLSSIAGHDPVLHAQAQAWQDSKRKSPVLAGALSAIFPGAGKVYAGRWKDGIVSFLFVGANAYSAYRGFKNGGINSPYGWIFGSLSAGFYFGNIYGATKAAKGHNASLESKIKADVFSRLLLIY